MELTLKGRFGSSQIAVDELAEALPTKLAGRVPLVIYDKNAPLPEILKPFEPLAIPAGEGCKSLSQAEKLYAHLVNRAATRDSLIIGVGGGALLDLVGFVASTFLRGIPCGYIPTTLLAQVDASVGGKTSLNFGELKNLIGTVTQPEFVICDPTLLQTLPQSLLADGVSECIKVGLINDRELFLLLESGSVARFSDEPSYLRRVIELSIQAKYKIVQNDEFETNNRRKLNFGHTAGHALERSCRLSHGMAVAVGSMLELQFAVLHGLTPEDTLLRTRALMERYELPTTLKQALPSTPIRPTLEAILTALSHDKKRYADSLLLPIIRSIGSSEVQAFDINLFASFLKQALPLELAP